LVDGVMIPEDNIMIAVNRQVIMAPRSQRAGHVVKVDS